MTHYRPFDPTISDSLIATLWSAFQAWRRRRATRRILERLDLAQLDDIGVRPRSGRTRGTG